MSRETKSKKESTELGQKFPESRSWANQWHAAWSGMSAPKQNDAAMFAERSDLASLDDDSMPSTRKTR